MPCHLTSLTLLRFRSHLRTRLTPDPRPVAIFGANGAGKTNLLEAVSLLSPGRGLRRAAPEDLALRPDAQGWKLRAEVATGAGARALETGALPGQSRSVRIDEKAAPQLALGGVLAVLWLTPAMDRLWTEAAEGRRRFLDRIAMSFAPDHGGAVLAYERAMRERNRLLRDAVTDPAWYRALEAQMAESGARIAATRRAALAALAAATGAAETVFPAADLGITGPEGVPQPEAEADIAAALAETRRRDMAAGRTLIGPHRADLAAIFAAKGQPAALCSTGEQKALLISLVLANARALMAQRGAPPVLLLDEVAAHLDADRRAALHAEVLALGAQAWMTGTGPELFAGQRGAMQGLEVVSDGGASQVVEADLP
ncbi:MAG: DNA replication/repair protein RecF [Rhodobacteraceae bacterium]|nr:DNA replication/repair protein RecF [Paracoccaceae bacterium]